MLDVQGPVAHPMARVARAPAATWSRALFEARLSLQTGPVGPAALASSHPTTTPGAGMTVAGMLVTSPVGPATSRAQVGAVVARRRESPSLLTNRGVRAVLSPFTTSLARFSLGG